jgi:hypothetical protein
MNKFKQKYSDELRRKIREQVLSGEPISKLSNAYKIPAGTIYSFTYGKKGKTRYLAKFNKKNELKETSKSETEILFNVCTNVYNEITRLEDTDAFRFVVMYCEHKLNEKRKQEWVDKQAVTPIRSL